MTPRALLSVLTAWALASAAPAAAVAPRIALLGDGYMEPVAGALDALGLTYTRQTPGTVATADPGAFDALFVAHDALGDGAGAALADWLRAYRRAGGKLFTFYTLPEPLSALTGIDPGPYARDEAGTRYRGIAATGVVAGLPALVRQRSANINRARALGDSVQVAARWQDEAGGDTGEPALLVGPAGAHLTHVLLGHDPAGAARMCAALLARFFPDAWDAAVSGALLAAEGVGGGPDSLAARAAGRKKAVGALDVARRSRAAAVAAAAAGRLDEALVAALRERDEATRALALSLPARAGELRAVWIHNPFGVNDWGWERSCQVLADAGFNAIIANMFDAGITSYPSQVLPVDARVAERGDQLAQLVQAAHRHGIQVHAWKVNYNLYKAPPEFVARMRAEGRLQANASGEEIDWLCPSHPDNRQLEVASMLEVVRNYDVDGIHFDYIRYPGVEGCFDDGCRLRFQSQTGHTVTDWPQQVLTTELAEPFQAWRQEQITALVRQVAVRSRQIRPEVQISAAVFPDWDASRYTVGQDWVQWVQEGYLDFVCPMDYIPDPASFAAMVRRQVDWVDGRVPLYTGIGAWQMASVEDVLRQVETGRRLGADGFVLFDFSADLAERILPLMKLGSTATPTLPPGGGPQVHFEVAPAAAAAAPASTEVPLFRQGETVTVRAQLVSRAAVPSATGALVVEDLAGGEELARLDGVEADAGAQALRLTAHRAGDFRAVVRGSFRDARGQRHPFVRRGPLLRVRSAAQLDSLAAEASPSVAAGAGVAVGVFADAYGATPILEALAAQDGIAAFRVRRATPQLLARTRVLVIPQPYNRWAFDRADRERLRAWVAAGGSLLVTHDMAGLRGAIPIVPEVCRRGVAFPRSVQWRAVADHPAVAGVPAGLQGHSYYDHDTLEPGPAGQVLAVDDADQPVLVAGPFGEGRYAALGLVPGLGPGDAEVPLVGAEGQLVTSLVAWLAGADR